MSDQISTSGPIPLEGRPQLVVDAELIEQINARFNRGRVRMSRLETDMATLQLALHENTELTQRNTDMTREIHELVTFWKSGMAAIAKLGRGLAILGRWCMKALKPLLLIAAAYLSIKHDVGELLRRLADIFKP